MKNNNVLEEKIAVKLSIFFCMYLLLRDKYDINQIYSYYLNYTSNFTDDIEGYKDVLSKNRIDEVKKLNNIKNLFDGHNKILLLSASTYYQSYFFDLDIAYDLSLYNLFYLNNNLISFIDKINTKFNLNETEAKRIMNSRFLYGSDGIMSFAKSSDINILRLNFDGGYFKKPINLKINNNVDLKISSNIFKIGHMCKADVIPCYFVKTEEGNIKFEKFSKIEYCEDFNKYKELVIDGLTKCMISLLECYPAQWVRWSTVSSQIMDNNDKKCDNYRSIYLNVCGKMFLFDLDNCDFYEVTDESSFYQFREGVIIL